MSYTTKKQREIRASKAVETEIMLENMLITWTNFIFKKKGITEKVTEEDIKDFLTAWLNNAWFFCRVSLNAEIVDIANENDLTVEVVYTSLKKMKENPELSIADSIKLGLEEWIK